MGTRMLESRLDTLKEAFSAVSECTPAAPPFCKKIPGSHSFAELRKVSVVRSVLLSGLFLELSIKDRLLVSQSSSAKHVRLAVKALHMWETQVISGLEAASFFN